jgi:hypothetical protein
MVSYLAQLHFSLRFVPSGRVFCQADLVPVLCQDPGSVCGATPAFSMLGANSYVYNYSIDLSAIEMIDSNWALAASP